VNYRTIALVDFSHALRVNYHARANDSGPNDAGQQTLTQLSGWKGSVEHMIVCLDHPPYDRVKAYPEYKAGRERDDAYVQICRWTKERLVADGYSIASHPGAEADDVIATLAATLDCPDIRILGSDKDSLQNVRESDQSAVRVFSPLPRGDFEIRDVEWVQKRYGVSPEQMPLFQAICGDKGDNIPGIAGIGDKGAAKLINEFGCIEAMGVAAVAAYEASKVSGAKPLAAFWRKFLDGFPRLPEWLALTTLRTDVPLDVPALLVKSAPAKLVEDDMHDAWEPSSEELEEEKREMADPEKIISFPKKPFTGPDAGGMYSGEHRPVAPQVTLPPDGEPGRIGGRDVPRPASEATTEGPKGADGAPVARSVTAATAGDSSKDPVSIVVDRPPAPNWALQLQPQTVKEADILAAKLWNSRQFAQWGQPAGMLSIILKGRELGLGAMAALEMFFLVKDRVYPSAKAKHFLATRDPDCEWFMVVSADERHATVKCKHAKAGLLEYTYTIDRAQRAGYLSGGNKHNWISIPQEMLEARAKSKAADRWFPGSTLGMPSVEEIQDGEGGDDNE
jgi:5'-3' exonuclease